MDQFFAVLAANGLTINLSKCTFMVPELEVFGHSISKPGTTPTPQYIEVIIEYSPPQDTKQLQRYLGMVNFYLRFKPGIASVLEPVTTSLKGGKKTLEWTSALDSEFQPLAYPAPNAAIALGTDASETVAHSTSRYEAPGNYWVSFLTSYNLQNRNTQHLTGTSSPLSPPSHISGTS
jgi:hypothetical protein